MSQAFTITQPEKSVPLKGEHEVGFTVGNNLGRDVLANAYVEMYLDDKKLEGIDWIEIRAGQSTFDLTADGSANVTVTIAVPDQLPEEWQADKSSLTFRLVIKNVDNPDEENGESVPITLHPAGPEPVVIAEPEPPNNLWKILAIVGGALALVAIIGAVVYFAVIRNGEPTPDAGPPDAAPIDAPIDAPAPLAEGEACREGGVPGCGEGLYCTPAMNICISKTPGNNHLCDPVGPKCPGSTNCRRGPDDKFRCTALPGEWQRCSGASGCSDPLTCGPSLRRCVAQVPAFGDYCDPRGPRCPSGGGCQKLADGTYRCHKIVGEGESCSNPNLVCGSGLQCGASLGLCIKERPRDKDMCDPRGPASCPGTSRCAAVGRRHLCVPLLDAGRPCDPGNSFCKPGLACDSRARVCVKERLAADEPCVPEATERCPSGYSCLLQSRSRGHRCTQLVDVGQSCRSESTACKPKLACGGTTQICVSESPGAGDLCDPHAAAPKCPGRTTCQKDGTQYKCSTVVTPPTGTIDANFTDFKLVYVPERNIIQISTGGWVVSYGQGWRPQQLKSYLHHLFPPNQTDTYWKINTSRRQIYLTTPSTPADPKGTAQQVTNRIEANFDKGHFELDTRTQKVRVVVADIEVSGTAEWRVASLGSGQYDIARTNWRGIHLRIDTVAKKVYKVQDGTFGGAGGRTTETGATVTVRRVLRAVPIKLRRIGQ